MSIYETLNREQQKACFQTEGPVLILAGAGSGKTRVITHRIAYLIDECEVNPWNILAITFTNKAAGEMRERVDGILGGTAQGVWISTFHSMCVRILRRHIDLLGYDPSFSIYDTNDQRTLMKEACKALKINTKELREREILAAVSSAKNELITPLQYREDNDRENFRKKQIGMAYEEYQRLLRKNNALDFDDLLMLTVELFHAREDVLEMYQRRFRYIMVDEYQDTNMVQFELVRLLAAGYKNLCVVGDDDQSIYKFRGADIRNILDFEKIYPEALVVRLEQNYRSTRYVLDAANAVIRNNRTRKPKALWTDKGDGTPVHVRQFSSAMEEASFVVQDIRRKVYGGGTDFTVLPSGRTSKPASLPERGERRPPAEQTSRAISPKELSYRDFAILYRTNAQARILEERLVLSSIPYNVIGGTNFYERREIRDVLCYLKTIDNGRDDIAVQRIINVPRRGIGATTLARASEYAAREQTGLFEVLKKGDQIPGVKKAGTKLRAFADMILSCREFGENHTLVELARHMLDVSGYVDALRASDEEDAEDRENNIEELISKLADYEQRMEEEDEEATLSGFLEDVALVADIDDMEDSENRVRLMTLHSAKGLEFPHVYITGLEENVFPSYQSLQDFTGEGLEEERRLAYVGITRAMDDLTLTSARSRMMRGEVQYNPVSRFIEEIPDELLDEDSSGRRGSFRRDSGFSYGVFPDDPGSASGGFGTGIRSARKKSGDDIADLADFDIFDEAGVKGTGSSPESRSGIRNRKSTGSGLTGLAGLAGLTTGRDLFRAGSGNEGAGTGDRAEDPAGNRRGGYSADTAGKKRAAGYSADRAAGARHAGRGTDSAGGKGTAGYNTDPAAGGRARPRAVYVKPHTPDEKKPYIGRKGRPGRIGAGSGKGTAAPAVPEYTVGDRVRHLKYGDGLVREIEKGPRDYRVTVQFDQCGQKIMYAGFAKLQKL